jgi:S-DNA-T family DNA segregation ATPase FtsK/SpoIIIE
MKTGGCIVMNRKARITASVLLFACSAAVVALLVLDYIDLLQSLPAVAGEILFKIESIFLQAVWALPVYLLLCGFLLLYISKEHPYGALFPFTLTLFGIVILFLHVQFGDQQAVFNQFVSSYIGLRSASIILLFIFILESVLFLIWFFNRILKGNTDRSRNYVLGQSSSQPEQRQGLSGTQYQGPAVGEDEDHRIHDLSLTFPELPELPRIVENHDSIPAPEMSRYRKAVTEPAGSRPPAVQPKVRKEDSPTAKKNVFGSLKPVDLDMQKPEEKQPEPRKPAEPQQKPVQQPPKEQTISFNDDDEIPALPPENSSFTNLPDPADEQIEESDRYDNEQEEESSKEDDPSIYEEDEEVVPGVLGLGQHHESSRPSYLDRIGYQFPPEDLLDTYPDVSSEVDRVTRLSGEVLMKTLSEFKIDAKLTGIQKGPVVTMYEILPAPGIRVQTITNLADNIALQLAASRVRMVAPIPGKQAVGIEVPNKERSIVSFKEMLNAVDAHSSYEIPMVLGKDITGESQVIDLTKTPHLLIAGATGSGKSVCVNSLICSILYRKSPSQVRLMMVDPKIVELKLYNDIPHLLTPVITDSKKAIKALQYCLYEMERRYDLLDTLNTRDIKTYNKKISDQKLMREKLPYIVLIIDEFADLMSTTGKEIESYLARLAAMARAVGIHLVLATQRPSTNVITGIIKANIPSRIAFMVASNTDSRIILDQAGAEKLLGRGDMLFSSSWDPVLQRVQGSFLSEHEVEQVVNFVKSHGEPDYLDESYFEDDEADDEDDFDLESDDGTDPLMDEALKIVYSRNSASASYLQRRLKIGYNRAARIIEEMEDRGIIGPARGSQPREVLRMTEIDT